MSCRRCKGPDSGTTDMCSRCEARVEFEQNRDDELEIGRPPAETSRRNPFCFLAQFSDMPCEGRLVRAHLLPRQLLKREGLQSFVDDPRGWVWSCGGVMGPGGHHGQLDQSRTLRIPRSALPPAVEQMAADLGLSWWLDREYPQEAAA